MFTITDIFHNFSTISILNVPNCSQFDVCYRRIVQQLLKIFYSFDYQIFKCQIDNVTALHLYAKLYVEDIPTGSETYYENHQIVHNLSKSLFHIFNNYWKCGICWTYSYWPIRVLWESSNSICQFVVPIVQYLMKMWEMLNTCIINNIMKVHNFATVLCTQTWLWAFLKQLLHNLRVVLHNRYYQILPTTGCFLTWQYRCNS